MDIKFYYIREEALETAERVPYTLYFSFDTKRLVYDDSRATRREMTEIYVYPTEDVRLKSADFDIETVYFVVESNRMYVFDYYAGWIQMGPDYFYYFEIPHIILQQTEEAEYPSNTVKTFLYDERFRPDSIPKFIVDPSLRDLIDDDKIGYESSVGTCTIVAHCISNNPNDRYPEVYGRLVVSNYEGTGFAGAGAGMYTNDHNQLMNRDAEDSHPIEAISGLLEFTNNELLNMWGRSDFIDELMKNLEGTMDHNKLINRNEPGAHPIEAITGVDEFDNSSILSIWTKFIPVKEDEDKKEE